MAFFRSSKQDLQDISDISHSMENVSMSDMDIDSKSQYTNLNKENITPGNSPTKSILHNSPQQQLTRSRFPQE